MKQYQQCNNQLLDFGMRAARCEGSLAAHSYNNLETTQKRVIHDFCSQEVKQNATAEQMICEQQVDLNNELEQTQKQRQEQIANLTVQIKALQDQVQNQEQYQEQVANLTAQIELLQQQNQEMENKQTTFQLSYASAAVGGVGGLFGGLGIAACIKSLCSGKSKDKKEPEQGGQSTQPIQVSHRPEPYDVIPLKTVVSVEESEDDNCSEERIRLNS